MVKAKQIWLPFVVVVIYFMCDVFVESSSKVDGDDTLDTDFEDGFSGISIGRDRRHASNVVVECIDCDGNLKELAGDNQLHSRLKRESNAKKRRKKKLKKTTATASRDSSSFSNYFSSFWKDTAKTSSVASHSKKKKNRQNTPKDIEDTQDQKPSPKEVSSKNSKPASKSFVNYFSNYWKDSVDKTKDSGLDKTKDSGLDKTKDSGLDKTKDSVDKTKDSGLDKTKDSGLDKTKDSGLDKTKDSGLDKTKDSKKVNKISQKVSRTGSKSRNRKKNHGKEVDSKKVPAENSLLNFYSSYWRKEGPESPKSRHSPNKGSEKVLPKVNKSKSGNRNNGKGKSSMKNQSTKFNKISKDTTGATALKSPKKEKGLKKTDVVVSKNNTRTEVEPKSYSNTESISKTEKDKEKKRKDKKRKTNKKKDKNKANKRGKKDRLKLKRVIDKTENNDRDKTIQIEDSGENDNLKSSNSEDKKVMSEKEKEDKAKSKSEDPSAQIKTRKKQRKIKFRKNSKPKNKTKTQRLEGVQKAHNAKQHQTTRPKKTHQKKDKSNMDKDLNENSNPTLVNFQGLKSDINLETDVTGNVDGRENQNELRAESTENDHDSNKLATQIKAKDNPEGKLVTRPDATKEIASEIEGQVIDKNEKWKPPVLTFEEDIDRVIRLKNSSRQENIDTNVLVKAERLFKKKEKRIMRKLSVLNQTTKKQFDKFVSVSRSHFNQVLPKASFNYSHPKQQSDMSRINIGDLKQMIVYLNSSTRAEKDYDKMTHLKSKNSAKTAVPSLHERHMMYDLPQGDDPFQSSFMFGEHDLHNEKELNEIVKKYLNKKSLEEAKNKKNNLKIQRKERTKKKQGKKKKQGRKSQKDGKTKRLVKEKKANIEKLKKRNKSKITDKNVKSDTKATKKKWRRKRKKNRKSDYMKNPQRKQKAVYVSLRSLTPQKSYRETASKFSQRRKGVRNDASDKEYDESEKEKRLPRKKHRLRKKQLRLAEQKKIDKDIQDSKPSVHRKRIKGRGKLRPKQLRSTLRPQPSLRSRRGHHSMKSHSKKYIKGYRKSSFRSKLHLNKNPRPYSSLSRLRQPDRQSNRHMNYQTRRRYAKYQRKASRPKSHTRKQKLRPKKSKRKGNRDAKEFKALIKSKKDSKVFNSEETMVKDGDKYERDRNSRRRYDNGVYRDDPDSWRYDDGHEAADGDYNYYRRDRNSNRNRVQDNQRRDGRSSKSGEYSQHYPDSRFDGEDDFRNYDDEYTRHDRRNSMRHVDENFEDEYILPERNEERGRKKYDDGYSRDRISRYGNENDRFEDEFSYSRRKGRRNPRQYRNEDEYSPSRSYPSEYHRGYSNSRSPRRRRKHRGSQNSRRFDNEEEEYVRGYPDSVGYDDDEEYLQRRPDYSRYDEEDDSRYSRREYEQRQYYQGNLNSRRDRNYGRRRGYGNSRSDRQRRHKIRSHARKHGKTEDDDLQSRQKTRKDQDLQSYNKKDAYSAVRENLDYEDEETIPKKERGRRINKQEKDPGDDAEGTPKYIGGNWNQPDPYYYDRQRQRQKMLEVLELQRKRQMQKLAPIFNEKSQRLKRHLQDVLRHFTNLMEKSEEVYNEIFNGTRYDVMNSVSDVYKVLHSANDDIYDAVMGSSKTTRSIFMKAYKEREAQIKGLPKDEPVVDLKKAEDLVIDRNFRKTLSSARMESRKLEKDTRYLKMLEMKHMQGEARLQQVREHLKERYDHETILNLFNNMRASIEYVNDGLATYNGLSHLRRDKNYIKYVKEEIDLAKSVVKNSESAVRKGMRKFVENDGLYRKWKREKRRRSYDRAQRDGTGSRLSYGQFSRLREYTKRCKRHSSELTRTAVFAQRTLERPIRIAKAALQRKTKNVDIRHSTIYINQLRKNIKDMIVAMDDLRALVERNSNVKPTRKCKDRIEGSGMEDEMGNDDEDLECIEEGGDLDIPYADAGAESDDFVFEENHDHGRNRNPFSNPMKSFGVKLSEFASQTFRRSFNNDEIAQNLIRDSQVLKYRLREMTSKVSDMKEKLTVRKDIQSNLITLKVDRNETKSKLKQISLKLSKIDFEELQSKVAEALENAKKNLNTEETIVVVPAEKEEKTDVESTTVPSVGKEDYFDYLGLFNKGKQIESNREDIKMLESLAVNAYSKSCSKMKKIHTNISALMQKVEKARNMLTSLQLSVSKTNDSPMPVAIPSSDADISSDLVTTMSLSIKPKTLDGTVLFMQGNQSASYTLRLSGGELTAAVYDEENDSLDSVSLDNELQENKWYTIRMIRAGKILNVSMKGQVEDMVQRSLQVDNMPLLQPAFVKSFIGGIPADAEISGDPWQGCVGELTINGRSLSVFQPTLNGDQVSLCSDHCVSQDKILSWRFDGDGFVHFPQPPQDDINSISITFRTKQSTGSILSAVNSRRRFHHVVTMDNGSVKVESSNRVENAVLLSINGSLNDGKPHVLMIQFIGGKTYPMLDGDKSAFSVEQRRPKVYRAVKEGILLGSFITGSGEFIQSKYSPLIGCVGQLVVNDKPTLFTDAAEIYHAQHGQCDLKTVWQACTSFMETSASLSFGTVENSNMLSVLVNRNANGPLLLYEKEDQFKFFIIMTNGTVDIIGESEERSIQRTNEIFSLLTVEDDGSNLKVSAYGESVSVKYTSWWEIGDDSLPHIIAIGQPREDDEQTFTGYLSQLVIGDRLIDLMEYRIQNKFENCRRDLKPIKQNIIREEKSFCS